MAIEIGDFPIFPWKMVDLSIAMLNCQRVLWWPYLSDINGHDPISGQGVMWASLWNDWYWFAAKFREIEQQRSIESSAVVQSRCLGSSALHAPAANSQFRFGSTRAALSMWRQTYTEEGGKWSPWWFQITEEKSECGFTTTYPSIHDWRYCLRFLI